MLQEVGQATAGVPQHVGSLPSVKHVDQKETKIPLQPHHVAPCPLQNLDDAGVGKDCGERRACSGAVQLVSSSLRTPRLALQVQRDDSSSIMIWGAAVAHY